MLRARGSELEAGFAFGVVRQLFERRLAGVEDGERDELLTGPAAAARPLLADAPGESSPDDTSFAVLHGLYWLTANLAARRFLVIAVDDAHWADRPSLRWLAYLAPRLEGLPLALMVALRPAEPASGDDALLAVRAGASTVARPRLLSDAAVADVARATLGGQASDDLCTALTRASGGNPFYLRELVRALELGGAPLGELVASEPLAGGADGIVRQVATRVRRLDPQALALAQALAILGDGCQLRHAAAIADLDLREAARLTAGLVRLEVLASEEPPRFLHPVLHEAVEASLGRDGRDAADRKAARLLHLERAPPGQVAAHLVRVRPAGDPWVVHRLREAARAAIDGGAPQAADELLSRALDEPPPLQERVGLLRDAARAEAAAGRETACARLEEALALADDPLERAEIAIEVAEAYAALFRWVEAVDVLERALAELGEAEPELAARLEGELIVAGLHDARRASRVAPVLERLASRRVTGAPDEALAVARGMAALLAGRPVAEAAGPLEAALACASPRAENWDTRAALLWSLLTAERFRAVEVALAPMLDEIRRSGSARGLVAVYSTLGLLKLRLGALPEADAASRVALRVLQEGDFAPGLAFAATVLADIAVEAGDLDEAAALLDLLPQEGWPAGVGTVLIPAARGRLRMAQGRFADAVADFRACGEMFSGDAWGMEMRDVGYLHARSGAALALLRLGERADAPRPRGGRAGRRARLRRRARARRRAACRRARLRRPAVARAHGPVRRRPPGLPRAAGAGALADRARSRAASGRPARRRARSPRRGARPRGAVRRPAARCPRPRGADGDRRPAAARVAPGRRGADAQRAARRPAGRRRADQSRDRLRALRHPQDRRGAPGARLRQARDHGARGAPRGARRRKDQGAHPVAKGPACRRRFGRTLDRNGGRK